VLPPPPLWTPYATRPRRPFNCDFLERASVLFTPGFSAVRKESRNIINPKGVFPPEYVSAISAFFEEACFFRLSHLDPEASAFPPFPSLVQLSQLLDHQVCEIFLRPGPEMIIFSYPP